MGIGDYIPVVMQPGLAVPISFLAVMKTGAAFAPIDVRWPEKRIQAVCDNLGASVLLTDRMSVEKAASVKGFEAIVVEPKTLEMHTTPFESPSIDSATAPIFVIHTSGSTGVPKGAINNHRGIVNRLLFMNRYFGNRDDDVIMQTTHHCFDSSVWQFFWPLINGRKCIIGVEADGLDIDNILSWIETHQVTITDFTPAVLATLYQQVSRYKEQSGKLASLRALLVGGEALSVSMTQKFRKSFPDIRMINGYGPTETSIGVIFYDIPHKLDDELPIGKPIDNVRALILDSNRKPLPAGATGELYIGGLCVGNGYLNNPEATSAAFVTDNFTEQPEERLYRTGDLARYREDGNIIYVGRCDHQIKLRGFRIELGDIEHHLEMLASVASACALIKKEASNNPILIAYVEGNVNDKSSLMAELSKRLPPYMIPDRITVLDKLPVATSGKIDRKALSALPLNYGQEDKSDEPTTITEKELAKLFMSVLEIKKVGRYDNFFHLGGHSLLATQLVSRIRHEMQVQIALRDIFQYPTVEELATKIDRKIESSVIVIPNAIEEESSEMVELEI